jgi:sodium-dependent dicarboxylate transporter 2/3/5
LLKPFGKRSEMVLLGFLLITGLFSMFVSNTATAAMMIAFLTPVLKALPESGKGRIALALAIPIGANIGGMGTPIGTPPNAIAMGYLDIGFNEWMLFMMPFVFLILFLCWFLLRFMFPFTQKEIELKIEGETAKGIQPFIVNVTFVVTILLWCLGKDMTGISANAVAILPIVVFCTTGIIKRRDLEEINWSVLWMVAGGFALGLALQKTGLAKVLIDNIPFGALNPVALLVVAGLLCWALSNFISNTATAALLIPILAVVAEASPALEAIGGSRTLLVGVAMAASFAMCLPISTPPNALAHSTGLIEQKHMVRIGVIVGIVGMTLGYGMLIAMSMF